MRKDLLHRFQIRLTSDDGSLQGNYPFAPDWYPAEEALRFQALRHGIEIDGGDFMRVEPVWGADGPPTVKSVLAVLMRDSVAKISVELPLTYFRSQVQIEVSKLQTDSSEKRGKVSYFLAAFPANHGSESAAKGGGQSLSMEVREIHTSPVFGERSLARYLEFSGNAGVPESDEQENFPVFIPSAVLQQARTLRVAAADKETGGTLIGYLWKDTESNEVFAEVTGLIPVQHAQAESTRLTFTPQTWTAVQNAISLRARNEQFIGWAHTHPSRHWCKCDAESQKSCPLGRQFFSIDDMSLHRTVFPRAFHIALVTGDQPDGEGGWDIVHSLWGWRNGVIQSRGFYVFDEDPTEQAAVAANGSAKHLPKKKEHVANP